MGIVEKVRPQQPSKQHLTLKHASQIKEIEG